MSLVGKIFTMLILILSIVFMAFAMMVFATHKNWKALATKYQADLATANAALKDAKELLEREKNSLASEQASRRAALAALQVRATGSEGRLAAKEKELSDLTAAHSEATQTAKEAQNRLATLEGETRKLRDDLRGEQKKRDQLFLTTVQLTE